MQSYGISIGVLKDKIHKIHNTTVLVIGDIYGYE
jgi:hypothetical protein